MFFFPVNYVHDNYWIFNPVIDTSFFYHSDLSRRPFNAYYIKFFFLFIDKKSTLLLYAVPSDSLPLYITWIKAKQMVLSYQFSRLCGKKLLVEHFKQKNRMSCRKMNIFVSAVFRIPFPTHIRPTNIYIYNSYNVCLNYNERHKTLTLGLRGLL